MQVARPPVRFYLLTDIGGRPRDDPMVLQTLKECAAYPPKLRLLGKLRPDGTWPIPHQRRIAEEDGPGPPFGWTYITMVRNLIMLGDYCTAIDEGHVRASLERILGWQADDGHIHGPLSEKIPMPHYNGSALRVFSTFGMGKDPRVQKLIRWLLRTQRPDGGWMIPYLEDVRYLPEYRYMRTADFTERVDKGEIQYGVAEDYADVPSCTWTTLLVLRGIAQGPKLCRIPEMRRATDLVLARFFTKNPHNAFFRSERNWTRLRYPTFTGSGLLALDILSWMGYGGGDPRMEKPIRWLMSMRGSDGLWSNTDRPHPEKDQWISEIAISILNRYAQSLRGEPFGNEAEFPM